MTLTIELPDDQAGSLAAKARQHGLSTEQYAKQVLLQMARGPGYAPERVTMPREVLLTQILALRDSIEDEKGVLSDSYPLIREDRER